MINSAARLAFGICVLTLALPAQQSLAELRREFANRRDAAAAATDGVLDYEDHVRLTKWFAGALTRYLAGTPKDADRAAARIELAATQLRLRDRDAAAATLRGLDLGHATMDDCFDAAELAEPLGLTAERKRWIDAGLAAAITFRQKMHAGMVVMTRLVEPGRAIALFEQELERANGEDEKAEVLWWYAAAVREREDREDGDYETVLERLAKSFPNSRFGRVAADRLRAMKLEVGDVAIGLAGTANDGKPLSLASHRGKVVVVYFWASWSDRAKRGLAVLRELWTQYPREDFAVLGVCLDDNSEELAKYTSTNEHPWRDLVDLQGFDSDHARRTNVESVPQMILVDRSGKVAGLRLYVDDPEDLDHTKATIEAALAVK